MAIIDRLSKRNGRLNTAWITTTFEVSDRQARRDIEYIRDRLINSYFPQSVDLIYDRSKNEYRLTGSQEELENLFAKSIIASAVAASSSDPIRDMLGNDSSTLSSKKRVKFISQASEMPDYTIFTVLMNAIEDKHRVKIWYRNINQIDSERIIEPLELINYSAIWYVNSFDLARKEIRTFSLSRIRKAEDINQAIEFSNYKELEAQDNSGYGIFMGGKVIEYTMRFYDMVALIVSNQVWHSKQKGAWLDDRTYQLTVPASNAVELIAKVLSYGADAEPVAPKEFVDRYKMEVKRLASKLDK